MVSSNILALCFIEFVKKRFRIGDFRKFEALPLQIFTVIFFNFGARATNHQKLENFFASSDGHFP